MSPNQKSTRLPKSIRKYLRKEKAELRRTSSPGEAAIAIKKLDDHAHKRMDHG